MRQLFNYIRQFTDLNSQTEAVIRELAEPRQLGKNEFLLREGQRCNHLWFLKSGMIRKYHLEDGVDVTDWIYLENQVFTSTEAYIKQTPATEYLQACETAAVIGFSRSANQEFGKYPQLEDFAKTLIEEQLISGNTLTRDFSRMSAGEKYNLLKETAPELFNRAKLGHIASLMGITQETLSRLRKKNC